MAMVRIEIGDTTADVLSPYDPTRVEIIKNIPGRTWNKAGKYWTIPRWAAIDLANRLREYGDTVELINATSTAYDNHDWPDPKRPAADPQAERIAQLEREKRALQSEVRRLKAGQAARSRTWAEEMLSKLTPDQTAAVHRALTRVLHPDLGVDPSLQRDLNVARDLLARAA